MSRVFFNRAIELIDDDLIAESATATKTANKKFSWPKIAVAAACLTLVVCLVPTIMNIMNFFEYNAEDPNWYTTHTYAYSVDEAVEKFGDDLLLDKLVLKDDYPVPYIEYILEHAKGGVSDRQTWRYISAFVNYGGERFSVKEDHITLYIFFKEDDPSLDGTKEYPGHRSVFEGGSTTTEINGVTVRYRELSNRNFTYVFSAEFKYDGNVYFLVTSSKDNEALFWDTLAQMLDP